MAATADQAVEVGRGVEEIPGTFDRFGRPDGNTVLIVTRSGVLVFDTGRHPAHAQAIVDRAHGLGLPVRVVVNSHWHLDHVSGNPAILAAFPDAAVWSSAEIRDDRAQGFLAHGRESMRAANEVETDPDAKAERDREYARSEATATFRIDRVIDASGPVTEDGRKLWVGYEPFAVTGGDVWLYDRRSKVLASGDLVTLPAPFLDTACAAGFLTGLDHLEDQPWRTLVPGHGPPMDRETFSTYHRAVTALFACSSTDATARGCAEQWAKDAGPLLADDQARSDAVEYAEYYVAERIRTPVAGCPG